MRNVCVGNGGDSGGGGGTVSIVTTNYQGGTGGIDTNEPYFNGGVSSQSLLSTTLIIFWTMLHVATLATAIAILGYFQSKCLDGEFCILVKTWYTGSCGGTCVAPSRLELSHWEKLLQLTGWAVGGNVRYQVYKASPQDGGYGGGGGGGVRAGGMTPLALKRWQHSELSGQQVICDVD